MLASDPNDSNTTIILTGDLVHIMRNNIGFPSKNTNMTGVDTQFNSWDLNLTPANKDFLSVTDPSMTVKDVSAESSGALGPRQADGSLPNVDFLKLIAGSQMIDKGTDVGLPFVGGAPDLGAYEFGAAGGVSGSGGALGSGGAGGTGGKVGSGGAVGTGGKVGTGDAAVGGAVGSGGVAATGGALGSGGVTATGGKTGTPGSGGVVGTGGKMVATGGSVGTGGGVAAGGVVGSGGAVASGGASSPSAGGTGGVATAGGTSGSSTGQGTANSGCSCRLGGVHSQSGLALLGPLMFALRLRKRR